MQTHEHQIDYLDTNWDVMDDLQRKRIALAQAVETAVFAKKQVPFYQEHFKKFSEQDIRGIRSTDEFALILPETTKYHVSNAKYQAFIPEINYGERDADVGRIRNFGTGGTTGKPTSVIYSQQDYVGFSRYLASSIKYDFRYRLNELKGLKIMGLYHGDHITNHVFRRAFSLLGMDMVTRPSTKNNPEHVYDFIQDVKPNALLGPPEDKSGKQTKGLTLDAIFRMDSRNSNPSAYRLNHKINPDFKMIFWSSMPISEDLQNYIMDYMDIPYQASHFGNTEVGSVGATCSHYPRDFHLGYRSNVVAIKTSDGKRIAGEGETGYLLFSKTGSVNSKMQNCVPTGTILLNYRSGDSGHLVQTNGEICECGRNTPVLKNIHRTEHIHAKKLFGCQED